MAGAFSPSLVADHAIPRDFSFVGPTTRDDMFEYLFVPALLAATGRTAEAHAALEDYHTRTKRGPEQKEYSAFRDRLNDWLRSS
jgi:hypothetical protein